MSWLYADLVYVVGNTGLDMSPFTNNVTFAGVNLVSIYRTNIPLFARLIASIMKLLDQGIIRPIEPIKIMSYAQIEEAFRQTQTGKHLGKIVLKAGDDDIVPVSTYRSTFIELPTVEEELTVE